MDLVNQLASQLGIDPSQAQKLAGAVMGQLKGNLPAEQADAVTEAVPEADEWSTPVSGPLGGLLGALGGGQGASLLASVAAMGITPDKLVAAAPVVIQFLQTRLPAPIAEKVTAAIPGLLGGQGGDALTGALGGLFGKR
jgi:uncharacterized protein (DUF2267 family)